MWVVRTGSEDWMNTELEDSEFPSLANRNKAVGAVLVFIGAYVTYKAFGYGLGDLSRLGAGALPFVLGILIALLGLLIAIINPDGEEAAPVIRWRPVVLILSALLAFALLVESAGLIVATGALVFISGMADPEHTWRSLLAIFVFLLGVVYVVFVRFLSIPFDMIGG